MNNKSHDFFLHELLTRQDSARVTIHVEVIDKLTIESSIDSINKNRLSLTKLYGNLYTYSINT